MKKQFKKRGQKIIKKFSRVSQEASAKSKAHIKTHIIERVNSAKTVRLWILEWGLLVFVITLFAIIQTIWYRNSYETNVFVSGGSYTEATLGSINSMNPLYATTSSEKTLAKLLFPGLLAVDTSGHLGNELAASVSADETGKIWTAKLRSNLRWSDGEPITARDVVFSFDLINNPSAKTSVSSSFASVKIETIDELTVKFVLPAAYVAFYDALVFPIIPAHILAEVEPALIYEHAFSTKPVTSGPFILNAVQPSANGKTIHLNKNPNYFRGSPMLNSFAIRTYNSPNEIVNALNRLEVSASADLSALNSPELTNSAIFAKKTLINSGAFAFINTMSPIFSDIRVRQALRYGIDVDILRDGLIKDARLDFPILDNQIAIEFPELPIHNETTAEQLLVAVGYHIEDEKLVDAQGVQPTINIATITTGHLPELATRLATQLTNLGFAVSTDIHDSSSSIQDFFANTVRPRNYDILLYEIDMGIDPDLFPYYHSSQATATSFNFSNYKSSVVDDILLSARTSFDQTLRKAKYRSFLEHWINDVPAIGLYRVNLSYYFDHTSRTFSENNILATPTDRFSDIIYWAAEKDMRRRTP